MAEAQQPPRAPTPKRKPPRSAVDKVQDASFPLVLRGYDRRSVDKYVADIAQLVAELEARQLRENVVQRALDEVGEQTAGVLQRAHEAAEELAARSRSQAEGRIQRAEREADGIRAEADKYAGEVAEDTRRLWEERRRLIEELRHFAEEVLAVADEALDRLPPPPPVQEAQSATDGTVEGQAAEVQPPSGDGDGGAASEAGQPTVEFSPDAPEGPPGERAGS